RRVDQAFDARRAALAARVEALAGSLPDDTASRRERLAAAARELRAGWTFAPRAGVVEGGGPLAARELLPAEAPPGPVLGRLASKRSFVGALAEARGCSFLLYIPIDAALEQA